MLLVRPIDRRDLDPLYRIAIESGAGFTSLPDNRHILEEKIDRSIAALHRADQHPAEETFLFVLEDSSSGEVAGCCGLTGAVGLDLPCYHYHIGTQVHHSRELGIRNEFRTLNLCNDYTGSAELCTLYLRPPWRQGGNGSLLSRCRFLFLAEHPEWFGNRVIAEMRGYTDAHRTNPFWEGLGRHFFSMDYDQADYLTGTGHKVFIAELMPRHAIYIHLLPADAQAVIGQVHPHTVPAFRMLQQEGFRYENYVDIFDAGPTLAAQQQHIRSVAHSRRLKVRLGPRRTHSAQPRHPCLLANTGTTDFRCLLAPLSASQEEVELLPYQADLLRVQDGDPVRVVALSERARR